MQTNGFPSSSNLEARLRTNGLLVRHAQAVYSSDFNFYASFPIKIVNEAVDGNDGMIPHMPCSLALKRRSNGFVTTVLQYDTPSDNKMAHHGIDSGISTLRTISANAVSLLGDNRELYLD